MPLVSVKDVDWRLDEQTRGKLRAEATAAVYRDAEEQAGVYAAAMGRTAVVPVEVVQDGALRDGVAEGEEMGVGLFDEEAVVAKSERMVFAPKDVTVTVECRATFHVEGGI